MENSLATLQALVCDVDGVLTDGTIWYDNEGREWKGFSARDGLIIKALIRSTVPVGWITGRNSTIVARRAQELGVSFLQQGVADKDVMLRHFSEETGVPLSSIAYIGDDWNDWPAMQLAGFSACPQDAANAIQQRVDWVIPAAGGRGVVRTFVERWKGVDFGQPY